jgi:hypothetical protein
MFVEAFHSTIKGIHLALEEMGLTPLPEVQQVLEATTAVATVSLSSLGEPGPPPKKVRTKGCLSPSARYAYVGCRIPPPLL